MPRTRKHLGMDIEKPTRRRKYTVSGEKFFINTVLGGLAEAAGVRRLPKNMIDEITPILINYMETLKKEFAKSMK
jgi:hypothetical protein